MTAELPDGTKRCTKCREVKPLEEFGRDARMRDGRNSWCRVCEAEDGRRYREANPEQSCGASRRYREANPEQVRAADRRYREANREQLREAKRLRYAANPEQYREAGRRYHEANPEQHRETSRRWHEEHGRESARCECQLCGLIFSTPVTWDWCHHRSPVTGRSRLQLECLDPASRGLIARQSKAGTVWGWPPDGQAAAEREIRRLRRKVRVGT